MLDPAILEAQRLTAIPHPPYEGVGREVEAALLISFIFMCLSVFLVCVCSVEHYVYAGSQEALGLKLQAIVGHHVSAEN